MAWKGTNFAQGYSLKNEYGLQFVWQYFPTIYSLRDSIRLKSEACYVQYIEFIYYLVPVAYPGILFGGGRGSTNSVEDRGQREWGSGGGSPLVRGSGGSCNLVQEISFHIVKFPYIFGTLRLFMMTTNLFVIANVKQLRT